MGGVALRTELGRHKGKGWPQFPGSATAAVVCVLLGGTYERGEYLAQPQPQTIADIVESHRSLMAAAAYVQQRGITPMVLGDSVVWWAASAAVSGFGVATLFPAAMRAASRLPGVTPATGVALVTWFSRIGFVISPLAVGLIAQGAGIAWGVGIVVVAAVAITDAHIGGLLRGTIGPPAREAPIHGTARAGHARIRGARGRMSLVDCLTRSI